MIRFFAAIKPVVLKSKSFVVPVLVIQQIADVGTIDNLRLKKNDEGKPKQIFSNWFDDCLPVMKY
jgi:hypothetical protein